MKDYFIGEYDVDYFRDKYYFRELYEDFENFCEYYKIKHLKKEIIEKKLKDISKKPYKIHKKCLKELKDETLKIHLDIQERMIENKKIKANRDLIFYLANERKIAKIKNKIIKIMVHIGIIIFGLFIGWIISRLF